MTEFRFTREARTAWSEAYAVNDGDHTVARADVHFTGGAAHATLVVHHSVGEDRLHDLLEALDDRIVSTADPHREDLIVTVWRGEEVGVFADDDSEGEGEDGGGEDGDGDGDGENG